MSAPTIGWSNFAQKNSVRGTGQSYSSLTEEQVVQLVRENWNNRTPGDGEGDRLDRKVLVPVPAIIHEMSVGIEGAIEDDNAEPVEGQIPANTPLFFCPPRVKLVEGMPIQARVSVRPGQENTEERPTVETWIDAKDAQNYDLDETPANLVNVVCYSAEALLENGGTRSTDCEWEIVTILASTGNPEPMHPLTMARNFLGMAGGTKSVYTAEEFARAIWFHANRGMKVKG